MWLEAPAWRGLTELRGQNEHPSPSSLETTDTKLRTDYHTPRPVVLNLLGLIPRASPANSPNFLAYVVWALCCTCKNTSLEKWSYDELWPKSSFYMSYKQQHKAHWLSVTSKVHLDNDTVLAGCHDCEANYRDSLKVFPFIGACSRKSAALTDNMVTSRPCKASLILDLIVLQDNPSLVKRRPSSLIIFLWFLTREEQLNCLLTDYVYREDWWGDEQPG